MANTADIPATVGEPQTVPQLEEVSVEATAVAGPSTDPSTPAEPATPVPLDEFGNPLSKKAQKRLAKRARLDEHKLEKRAAERSRRRDRQSFLSKGYAAGTLSADDAALFEKQRSLKRQRKAASKGTDAKNVWPGGVVVDLGFDNLMTEQEITSMAGQVSYVYSSNRTAPRPFSAVVCTEIGPGPSPRLWEKLAKAHWWKWNRMHFWAEGVDVLAKQLGAPEGDAPAQVAEETQSLPEGIDDTDVQAIAGYLTGPNLPATMPATHKLVYLSADAEEELTTLSEDEVYVIGGIVDRNRHKMLCQNKADGLNIRTARLPIGTFIANLPTRKVLTVNQVFDILVQYIALQDWAAAFEAVIPQRKYFEGKIKKNAANKARKKAGAEGEEEEGAEEDEEEGMNAPGHETRVENGLDMEVDDDEEAAMNA